VRTQDEDLEPAVFERLLAFRVSLRRFQHWSESQARAAGLTHVQHQLLVAVKGHPGGVAPTIGEIAGYLLLRHHSAVELADRAERAGLIRRLPDSTDARIVRVQLTRKGDALVTELTRAHLAELHKLSAALGQLSTGGAGPAAPAACLPAPGQHASPDGPR
jgi:DNA-binding MarR family transcriptional regulator